MGCTRCALSAMRTFWIEAGLFCSSSKWRRDQAFCTSGDTRHTTLKNAPSHAASIGMLRDSYMIHIKDSSLNRIANKFYQVPVAQLCFARRGSSWHSSPSNHSFMGIEVKHFNPKVWNRKADLLHDLSTTPFTVLFKACSWNVYWLLTSSRSMTINSVLQVSKRELSERLLESTCYITGKDCKDCKGL